MMCICIIIQYNSICIQQGQWQVVGSSKKSTLKSFSDYFHSHLTPINQPKCVCSSTHFSKLVKRISIFLFLYSLPDGLSQVKLKIAYTATALLLWQKCLEFQTFQHLCCCKALQLIRINSIDLWAKYTHTTVF